MWFRVEKVCFRRRWGDFGWCFCFLWVEVIVGSEIDGCRGWGDYIEVFVGVWCGFGLWDCWLS